MRQYQVSRPASFTRFSGESRDAANQFEIFREILRPTEGLRMTGIWSTWFLLRPITRWPDHPILQDSSRAKLECLPHTHRRNMLVSKEYMGYLARQVTKKLIEGEFIETKNLTATIERVHAAVLEEMQLEDRINDEVRLILEAYQDEMRTTGASYQEMFKKVKQQLVQKYKAVL